MIWLKRRWTPRSF